MVGYVFSFLITAWYAWRSGFEICKQKSKRGRLALAAALASLHTALFALCVAYTWSVVFFPASEAVLVRLGAPSSTSLKLWARHPAAKELQVSWAATGRGDVLGGKLGPVRMGVETEDYTVTTELTGLLPDTHYTYSVAFTLSDKAPHAASAVHRGAFTTLPSPAAAARFRFVVASCIMKSERMGRDLDGLQRLAELQPRFWVGLGDFVYADVPLTHGLGTKEEWYRAHYRRTMSDPHMRSLQRNLPAFHQVITPAPHTR
jgi:phosphodiesterase/alkaline phosphatase D-like protein